MSIFASSLLTLLVALLTIVLLLKHLAIIMLVIFTVKLFPHFLEQMGMLTLVIFNRFIQVILIGILLAHDSE